LGTATTLSDLKAAVERFKPKELLARRFFHEELTTLVAGHMLEHRLLIETLPEAILRDETQQRELLAQVLGKNELASQPCGPVAGGEALLAAMLVHFQSLQASLNQFLSVRPLDEPNTMVLDETAVRDLELFETVRRRQSEGSLFREI